MFIATASGELLEKARHHRQKIIHPQTDTSAYNRHVSMVRDAHWQSNDPNFHRFSSWLPPRQLLAAVAVALLLVDTLAIEKQDSKRVGIIRWGRFALIVALIRVIQASLHQPKSCCKDTTRPLHTLTNLTRLNTLSISSTLHTTSTSKKIFNLERDAKQSPHKTTSATVSAGVFMFVTAVACLCM